MQEDLARQEREEEIKRRRQERRHMLKLQQEAEARIGTPPPVDGRRHSEIQTEAFLEEIRDRPVEKDIDTQTDALLDRPPSPMFIPKKSGKDRETQIWPGELFDFDSEIDPLLEVIVGKTLEQSLMEVQQVRLRSLFLFFYFSYILSFVHPWSLVWCPMVIGRRAGKPCTTSTRI